jgi:hypothetical protein
MTFQPGTQVSHETYGNGTVVDRTTHTHPQYERVEFEVQNIPSKRWPNETRTVRLRVKRSLLKVLG